MTDRKDNDTGPGIVGVRWNGRFFVVWVDGREMDAKAAIRFGAEIMKAANEVVRMAEAVRLAQEEASKEAASP